ncbi:MAG: Gmad2 immunoglobulin-like domain-containing protein [Anaerolineae bacterium]
MRARIPRSPSWVSAGTSSSPPRRPLAPRVQTGFRLRGCGDVFEADFGRRLRDAAGAILVDDHAMMSCGTGCVGTFDLPVSYPPQAQPQMGSLEIYTTSMADGAEQLRAVIPVVLH